MGKGDIRFLLRMPIDLNLSVLEQSKVLGLSLNQTICDLLRQGIIPKGSSDAPRRDDVHLRRSADNRRAERQRPDGNRKTVGAIPRTPAAPRSRSKSSAVGGSSRPNVAVEGKSQKGKSCRFCGGKIADWSSGRWKCVEAKCGRVLFEGDLA